MKRIVVLAVAALALAMGIPSLALADDVNGPNCADIVGGSGTYGSTGNVSLILDLAAPSCGAFTYTYYVVTAQGTQELNSPVAETEEGDLIFQTTVDPSNDTICVYATTSVGGGKHVFDQALDAASCFPVARSSSPGFTGFS